MPLKKIKDFITQNPDKKVKQFFQRLLKSSQQETVDYSLDFLDPMTLTPTQAQIDFLATIKPLVDPNYEFPEFNPIIVLNSKFILDGHHRWAQAIICKRDQVYCINIKLDTDPETLLMGMHVANTLEGIDPAQEGIDVNIFEMSEDAPESVTSLVSDIPTPPEWAFDREDMPQISSDFSWNGLASIIGAFPKRKKKKAK